MKSEKKNARPDVGRPQLARLKALLSDQSLASRSPRKREQSNKCFSTFNKYVKPRIPNES